MQNSNNNEDDSSSNDNSDEEVVVAGTSSLLKFLIMKVLHKLLEHEILRGKRLRISKLNFRPMQVDIF